MHLCILVGRPRNIISHLQYPNKKCLRSVCRVFPRFPPFIALFTDLKRPFVRIMNEAKPTLNAPHARNLLNTDTAMNRNYIIFLWTERPFPYKTIDISALPPLVTPSTKIKKRFRMNFCKFVWKCERLTGRSVEVALQEFSWRMKLYFNLFYDRN